METMSTPVARIPAKLMLTIRSIVGIRGCGKFAHQVVRTAAAVNGSNPRTAKSDMDKK